MNWDLKPRDCEECACTEWQWDGHSRMLKSDPPSRCRCGHLTVRHRFTKKADR